jgi:hypothetical protein
MSKRSKPATSELGCDIFSFVGGPGWLTKRDDRQDVQVIWKPQEQFEFTVSSDRSGGPGPTVLRHDAARD